MKIDNKGHLISEASDPSIDLSKISTDKTSGKFSNSKLPDTIVVHYTAGTTARGAIATLTDPSVKASAHIVVDTDGSISQLVPFSHVAWHAGKSSYNGRIGLNKYSIGIEIVNPGFINKLEDGSFKTVYGSSIKPDQVAYLTHRNELQPRYWHIYNDVQIETVTSLCKALKVEYPIQLILGHEEIAPQRKTDPGPAFPLDGLRSSILDARSFDDDDDLDTGVVAVDNLNIRLAGDASSQKVALPLKKNSRVEILKEKDGWYKVRTEIEGWVSAKYIK